MPTVEFVRLRKPEKAKHLAELAEEYFQAGARVLILVQDANQGVTLDRFLWSWNKSSFLPHAFDNGSVDCFADPIVICVDERSCNGATVLIMGKPCSLDFMRNFTQIIDFAELYDDDLAAASRQRFAAYREARFAPRMRE